MRKTGDDISVLYVVGMLLFAHTAFGLFGVFVKYLLQYLPPFGFMALAFAAATPVAFLTAWRSLDRRLLRSMLVITLAVASIIRSLTKIFALRFTLATYVQLIDLTTPFFTVLVAWLLIRESMPSRTLPALVVVSAGSFLIITQNPFAVQLPNGRTDIIGIILALISALGMATIVVSTRYLTEEKLDSAVVWFLQVTTLMITYGTLAVVTGEGVGQFLALPPAGWAVLALFVLTVVGGTLTQIMAISRVKATFFSSLLSWRLVVVVAAAWLLLDEQLSTVWQVIGVITVVTTITLYLRYQSTRPPAQPET